MYATRSLISGIAAVSLSLIASQASAQISGDVVRIGVLTDMNSIYADINGMGAVEAARMAVEDYGGTVRGKKIDLVFADTQNKPDIGVSVGGRWIDVDGVDMIAGASSSAVSLAIQSLVGAKNKVFLASDPASSDITGKLCNANTIHWVYDTYALAHGTGSAVVAAGGDTWFFLTADYAFGYALERDVGAVVTKSGGKVLGSVRHPLNTSDFSSFILQAQSSKSKIVGLANAGGDTINSIKQAAEFGVVRGGQKLAGLLVFISDIHSLGLETAQGLQLTSAFYWDRNEETRAWSKRWGDRFKNRRPTMAQAGFYSSIMHYLKAVEALGTDEPGDKVVAKMKEMPTDDPLFGKGTVRIDGRKMHDMYLFEVKKPSESKGPWDYYKLIRTIPAEQAFRPLDQGGCKLVKN
jgi:branched-chain amino acid transport system substrate-binding protein